MDEDKVKIPDGEDTVIIPDKKKISEKVKDFFSSNPWVGMLTTILTIVGFAFGIYTYVVPIGVHDLTYSVSPVKAVAVKSGQVTDLEVSYKGTAISTDITVVQLAVWNKGRLPIRAENILRGIQITTSPTSQILDASIRKQSRDVIDFQVDSSHFTEGYIPLSWKILERNDGAVIQIIYAGTVDTDIKVTGVVEGQTKIHYEELKPKDENDDFIFNPTLYIISLSAFVLMIFMTIIMKIIEYFVLRKENKKQKLFKLPNWRTVGIIILYAVIAIVVSNLFKGGPPFGSAEIIV